MPAAAPGDDTRRTWLASEQTWLSWLRAGVAVGALALVVGRLLPAITSGERWAFRVLGIGYGVLSVVILLVGAVRQRRAVSALRRGAFEELTTPWWRGSQRAESSCQLA